MKSPHCTRRSAPHHPATIGDCVTDLPSFEWTNPHRIIPETSEQKSSRLNREKNIAQHSTLNKEKLVGLEKQPYGSEPLCEYQRKMRKLVPNQFLYNHVNHRPSLENSERHCNVPLRAGATYEDIPKDILPDFLQRNLKKLRGDSSYKDQYRGRFGRQSVDQSFKVVTTVGETASSSSWTLHPYLHRSYSAREYARAQGFPDSFTWNKGMGLNKVHSQIGNAVPVPLAKALGNELWKVLQSKSRIPNSVDNNQKKHEQEIDEKETEEQEDIDAMDDIEENIAKESMVISDEDMDDEEDIELEDQNIQNEYAEEEAMVISDEDTDDEDTDDEDTDDEDPELEDDTDHSSDPGEERIAMTAINEGDQDIIMIDEEDVEPNDELEQNAMGTMMEREGARRKPGESRYDAIVLDDSD
ncbi:hypothetical protein MFRU_006g00760 [Monilinia fructicola]|nr:hypothetical protein MFRU_006g00760 [Monilinia fructicola]